MRSTEKKGSSRNRADGGFTLIELLTVVAIVGIVAAIAIPSMQYALKRARFNAALSGMGALQKALVAYNVDAGSYPATLDVNTLQPLKSGGYLQSGEAIVGPLEERRLGAYVVAPAYGFIAFFKVPGNKAQFYLFEDGVYYRDPATLEIIRWSGGKV